MPVSPSAVDPQPHSRKPLLRARRPALRPLVLLLGLAVLFPVAAFDSVDSAAARGRSCTGWRSTTIPPKTIRVGRNGGRGPVQVVNFRRYVGVVMAKEWPGYLPRAALQAGAVAVKQYAWYHALAGNHRSSFRTRSGRCFDVVDSTRDQLYKPGKVRVSRKIWRAVDATWGLSLRKRGRFFMTGYRAGSARRCAADADGRKLFARSVVNCARRGLSRQEIQARYYRPHVGFVWSGQRAHRGSSIAPSAQRDAAASPPAKRQSRLINVERLAYKL